jgi:hypothetical protein
LLRHWRLYMVKFTLRLISQTVDMAEPLCISLRIRAPGYWRTSSSSYLESYCGWNRMWVSCFQPADSN